MTLYWINKDRCADRFNHKILVQKLLTKQNFLHINTIASRSILSWTENKTEQKIRQHYEANKPYYISSTILTSKKRICNKSPFSPAFPHTRTLLANSVIGKMVKWGKTVERVGGGFDMWRIYEDVMSSTYGMCFLHVLGVLRLYNTPI